MTIEKSGFFASVNGDRLYDDDEFARFFGRFLQDGYFPLPEDGLFVEADGSNILTVRPGSAWIQGRTYELLEPKKLTVEPGGDLLPRRDRVVVRCDYVNREITVKIKKGVEASDPKLPELQRDSDAYELGLAHYRIDPGITNLIQAYIGDSRKDIDVCGEVTSIIDKHTLKEFCKVAGFTMQGDIITRNLLPYDNNCTLGSREKPYKKIYANDLELTNGMPYVPLAGGTMTGTLYSASIVPDVNNGRNIGSSDKRYANGHFTNLYVYGEHPFFNKTGGTITGGVKLTYRTTGSTDYQMKFQSWDGNTQGDTHTYIGYNLNGLSTHIFRGLGNFNVANPVATFEDLRMKEFMLNNKRLYMQSTPPAGAPEGSVWIKC